MPKKYVKHGRKPRKPTPRQENFVKGIAAGKTLTQAALDAGYSPKNPDQSGYRTVVRQIVVRHIKRISFSLAGVLRFGIAC
jgi:phage terminase small subunit